DRRVWDGADSPPRRLSLARDSKGVAFDAATDDISPTRLFDEPRWAGGRAVEGSGLENRQARKGLVGSNPTLPVFTPGATHAGRSTSERWTPPSPAAPCTPIGSRT